MKEDKEKIKKIDLRLGNIGLKKASYIGEEPSIPSIQVVKYQKNRYYGNEQKYKWSEDGEHAYEIDEDGNIDKRRSIHKSCFRNPETNFALASFEYDEHEDFFELHFCGDRPLDLDSEERDLFWKILRMGNAILNKSFYESCI